MNTYKKYIYKKFIESLLKILILFICIIFIMSFMEEIMFFKDTNQKILTPFFLTLMNLPSILFEIIPFIFLITSIFFFYEFIENNEINNLKIYGITNINILKIMVGLNLLIGIFLITIFYNLAANLKFAYLETKNKFSKDDKYLAVVTENGLWLKDISENSIKYVNADKIENEKLINVSVTEFDSNFKLILFIIADSANIKNKNWILNNVTINNKNRLENTQTYEIKTNFDFQIISNIFDNLSSMHLFELERKSKLYELLGYNTKLINGYKHKIYSYPLYIIFMVIIGSIIMLNTKHNKSKIFHIILGILISVLIYYLDYLFNIIVQNSSKSYIISVWGPQIILFCFITINLLKLNEK